MIYEIGSLESGVARDLDLRRPISVNAAFVRVPLRKLSPVRQTGFCLSLANLPGRPGVLSRLEYVLGRVVE